MVGFQVPLPNGDVPHVDLHEVPLSYRSDERYPLVWNLAKYQFLELENKYDKYGGPAP